MGRMHLSSPCWQPCHGLRLRPATAQAALSRRAHGYGPSCGTGAQRRQTRLRSRAPWTAAGAAAAAPGCRRGAGRRARAPAAAAAARTVRARPAPAPSDGLLCSGWCPACSRWQGTYPILNRGAAPDLDALARAIRGAERGGQAPEAARAERAVPAGGPRGAAPAHAALQVRARPERLSAA